MVTVTIQNIGELVDSNRLQRKVRGNKWVTVERTGSIARLNGFPNFEYVCPGGRKGQIGGADFDAFGKLPPNKWRGL